MDPRKLVEALTPIRETTFEDYEEHIDSHSEQVLKAMAAANKERKAKEEVAMEIDLFLNNSLFPTTVTNFCM